MRTTKGAVDVVGEPVVRVLTGRLLVDRAVLDLMASASAGCASNSKQFFWRDQADLLVLDERDLVSAFGPESVVDLKVGFAEINSGSIEVDHLMASCRDD